MLPRLSHWSFPASLVPPKLSNQSFPASLVPPWCLPGCPISASRAVQLVLSCFPGASQAVHMVLSCLPGASLMPPRLSKWSFPASLAPPCGVPESLGGICQRQLFTRKAARSHGKAMRKALEARKSHVECLRGSRETLASWHLPGCPKGLSMALGGLPGEQNQIWPWQITGVSWSCLGRLLGSSGRGYPKPHSWKGGPCLGPLVAQDCL